MKSMSLIRWVVILTIAIFVGPTQVYAQQPGTTNDEPPEVALQITKKLPEKWTIAVRDFLPMEMGGGAPEGVAQGLPEVLRDNLELTGLFWSLDKKTFLEANPRAGLAASQLINFKEWGAIGAKHLVKGGFTLDGEALMLELRLFDVNSEKMILGKRYRGARKDGRKMINRFTNEILYVLTGEYGVFGSQIVFVAGTRSTKSVMLTELGGQEVVGVAGGPGPSFAPTMSKSGAIAYIHRAGKDWQLKLGGKTVSGGPLHLSPAFMPDGSILAALSGKHATNIYRFSTSGGRPTPVTNLPGINISPSVSPDGARMAFVSDRAGTPHIYITSTGGGAVRRLTTAGSENMDPDWSPRGDRIAYSSKGDIYTIAPDGSDLQRLTAGMGKNTRPTWSPDGRLICFATTRRGRSEIWVMTANGDVPKPIMPDYKGDQRDPYWNKAMPDLSENAGG